MKSQSIKMNQLSATKKIYHVILLMSVALYPRMHCQTTSNQTSTSVKDGMSLRQKKNWALMYVLMVCGQQSFILYQKLIRPSCFNLLNGDLLRI
mmetsp:Transcript_14344/g.20303  ORF Transcript_14344/g.20303 Transcript_14344/m.20303 type:complete len:94 (-) Transcript_14344:128-409(-)